jgi:WD40 repeat protein
MAHFFDGTRIVSGSGDPTIRVFDACTGHLVTKPFIGHTAWVRSVVFSPDGTRIIFGSDNQAIRVWGIHIAALIIDCLKDIHLGSTRLRSRPTVLVFGLYDQTLRVWNAHNLFVGDFNGHAGGLNSASFSPDGARIVSGAGDYTARLWDA